MSNRLHAGDFRGQGEATEVWTGEAWVSYPFGRELEFSRFPANRRAMDADGRLAALTEYLTP